LGLHEVVEQVFVEFVERRKIGGIARRAARAMRSTWQSADAASITCDPEKPNVLFGCGAAPHGCGLPANDCFLTTFECPTANTFENDCSGKGGSGIVAYDCAKFTCPDEYHCEEKFDFHCGWQFTCGSSSDEFECWAGHVFHCWEKFDCKTKFTCRGGVDPDDPDHPDDPEPCTEQNKYTDDENPDCPTPHDDGGPPNVPGDFQCAHWGPAGGHHFTCEDVFHCRSANEFDCFKEFHCHTGEGEGEFVCRYPEEEGFDCHLGEDDKFHCDGGNDHGCDGNYEECTEQGEFDWDWCPE
jgi:hypothetical protein